MTMTTYDELLPDTKRYVEGLPPYADQLETQADQLEAKAAELEARSAASWASTRMAYYYQDLERAEGYREHAAGLRRRALDARLKHRKWHRNPDAMLRPHAQNS